jgi:hypothetical protein
MKPTHTEAVTSEKEDSVGSNDTEERLARRHASR